MAFLNISVKNKNGILKDIDRQNYFQLGSVTRTQLYNFALALGYHRGYPSDLDGGKESFIREEYVKDSNQRFYYSAIYFAVNEKNGIEDITDREKVFPLMDKYANTGFSIISDYMSKYADNALALKLIAEMDEMYTKFKADFGEKR